ncbi:hypothetical protein EVAR_99295_1 [Eumeta japonica]|uniref:Uncharacterized protein n=1 Tax=Eumeta variegata TaxID=151549 RepID=A0A4C1ZZM9_EUMVA|nr:hypothetical protein EVAR_99295_1 [Eumeta japonica]
MSVPISVSLSDPTLLIQISTLGTFRPQSRFQFLFGTSHSFDLNNAGACEPPEDSRCSSPSINTCYYYILLLLNVSHARSANSEPDERARAATHGAPAALSLTPPAAGVYRQI